LNGMLGLLVGLGGSAVVVCMSWTTYKRLADPAECRVIESILRSTTGVNQVSTALSRPAMLLEELALVRDSADKQVHTFNDALADVDSSTRSGLHASKLMARIAFMAGMAGGTLELASRGGSTGASAVWALGALLAGTLGAAACTVIGQRAISALSRRRRLWDDLVRWILNSQFPQTELNLPGVHSKDVSGDRTMRTQL